MTDLENNLDVNKLSDEKLSEDLNTEDVSVEAVAVANVVVSDNNIEEAVVEDLLPVKTEEVKEDNVIGSGTSAAKPAEKPAITPVADGVIGSGKSKTQKKADVKPSTASAVKTTKVALFSNRNVVWQGVGKIVKGYNLVDSAAAEKWLTLDGIRKAEPQEVKTALG